MLKPVAAGTESPSAGKKSSFVSIYVSRNPYPKYLRTYVFTINCTVLCVHAYPVQVLFVGR